MQSAQYLSAIKKFRSAMEEYTDGWANEDARKVLFACIADIEAAAKSGDGYTAEKVSDLKSKVDRLFSARKHLSHAQGSSTGVEVLRGDIHSLITRLESWPGIRERINRLK